MASPYILPSERLNAHNYHDWKFRVKNILMKEGLWKIVDEKRKAPTVGKSDDTTALDKWEDDCENALATIRLTIGNSEKGHIENCTTAVEVWKKLAEVYEKKGVAHELYLRHEMANFKKQNDDTMKQHIDRLTDIVTG